MSLLRTSAPRAVILIRLLVGGVFLAEGIQKFLFPAELGAGRFAKIGIPWLGSFFLIITGGGGGSLDAMLARRSRMG